MGNMRKPDGLVIAGIYEVQGERTLICVGMWFGAEGLEKAEFYEPGTNKKNELTSDEIAQMFEKGTMTIKSVETGRKVWLRNK